MERGEILQGEFLFLQQKEDDMCLALKNVHFVSLLRTGKGEKEEEGEEREMEKERERERVKEEKEGQEKIAEWQRDLRKRRIGGK